MLPFVPFIDSFWCTYHSWSSWWNPFSVAIWIWDHSSTHTSFIHTHSYTEDSCQNVTGRGSGVWGPSEVLRSLKIIWGYEKVMLLQFPFPHLSGLKGLKHSSGVSHWMPLTYCNTLQHIHIPTLLSEISRFQHYNISVTPLKTPV